MHNILGKERALHYLKITTGTDLCPFPKNIQYLNIILQTAITLKFIIGRQLFENLKNWKTAFPKFGIFEKLEEDK